MIESHGGMCVCVSFLCRGITSPQRLQIVSLAALLHDVADRKYSGSDTATREVATRILLDAVCELEPVDTCCRLHGATWFPLAGCVTR